MKPLGQKHYKDNTGGKHNTKVEGKTESWWEDCNPTNKTVHRKGNSVNLGEALDEYDQDWEDTLDNDVDSAWNILDMSDLVM